MKYDDAEYYFLNFETDALPNEAGATHIGMFMAWMMLHDLVSEDLEEAIDEVKSRQVTGREIVVDASDCKLLSDDLSEEGNAFAAWYYEDKYIGDYCRVFEISGDSADALCSVEDTWDNFDKLAPVLDQRFAEWQAQA
ncbi:hypothetical protein [Zoogloea sp.]|uniref:DUF7832 domain-containing protein n=1 Tax=Zoogloea sp. TaxID=49181 RepID=UPI0035B4983A